jgi:predicted RNase H-like nuclease (RuvC/YqgF family)
MEATLIGGGFTILGLIIGYLIKSISGQLKRENRREDANAAESYSVAATNTANMMIELQRKVSDLTSRVEALEKEKDALQTQVIALKVENENLRTAMNRRGLAKK